MAQRGRKPKPTAIKELEGNPGKRQLNTNEPKPDKKAPECPDWLEDDAKAEWYRLAKQLERLGILTEVDMAAFAGYCQSYARWKAAEQFISKNGAIVKTPSGYWQQVPQVSIAQQYLKDVTATCTTPGMAGNVKAGAINRFPVTLPGLTAVVNVAAFTGGYEAESDADLLERYIEKVSRPNVSGNKYQYEEWAKEISGVGSVMVVPLWNGAGTVKVIITDAENQPATAELVAAVQAHIDENRPVGANATVVSAASQTINISVQLECTNKDTIADKRIMSIDSKRLSRT